MTEDFFPYKEDKDFLKRWRDWRPLAIVFIVPMAVVAYITFTNWGADLGWLWIMVIIISAMLTIALRFIPKEYRTGISGMDWINSQRTYTIVPAPKKLALPPDFFGSWKKVASQNISSVLPRHLLLCGFDVFSIFSGQVNGKKSSAIHARL